MKFLCDTCKQHFLENQNEIRPFWAKTVHMARAHAAEGQMDKAVYFYGNGLDAYELLFQTSESRAVLLVDGYILSGMEMVLALRKMGFDRDVEVLVQRISDLLTQVELPKSVAWYIQPLVDVTNQPICAVNVWMQQVLEQMAVPQSQAVH